MTDFVRKIQDFGEKKTPIFIVDRATRLAGHALASAQANFGTLVQFYCPDFQTFWVLELLSNTGSQNSLRQLSGFMKMVYRASGVANRGTHTTGILIVASQGRVLFPRAMLDHSTRQGSLIELALIPGRIHYDDSCFDAVLEESVYYIEINPYVPQKCQSSTGIPGSVSFGCPASRTPRTCSISSRGISGFYG